MSSWVIAFILYSWLYAQPAAAAALRALPSHEHPSPTVLAPGYTELEFTPPSIGSYALPPLGVAANGQVLDTQGQTHELIDYLGDKIVILSFIFTTCSDANGCPLATHVLRKLQQKIQQTPALTANVRLLSFSFDPDHDTPTVLGEYAGHFKNPGFDWQFLTTRSVQQLNPILEDYGQWVIKDYDPDGNYLGTMSHLLRVFLIDREQRIRNIYSVSFLHADTVANDIASLMLETKTSQP